MLLFQSTPGLLAGRYPPGAGPWSIPPPVSIHARLISRAIRLRRATTAMAQEFQSTPGLLAGRYVQQGATQQAGEPFQSTPGLLAGRYLRAMLKEAYGVCFNPRPAY